MSKVFTRPNLCWNYCGRDMMPPFAPMLTLNVRCYHCGGETRIPGPTVCDTLAKKWEDRYDRLMASLNDMLAVCTKIHGDNPVAREARWCLEQLEIIREKFSKAEEGEEWKRPQPPKGEA